MAGTPTPSNTTDQELRKLRHDIRGCMHGMQLCLSALETPLTPQDAAEFVTDVERAAERMEQLMLKLEELPGQD